VKIDSQIKQGLIFVCEFHWNSEVVLHLREEVSGGSLLYSKGPRVSSPVQSGPIEVRKRNERIEQGVDAKCQ